MTVGNDLEQKRLINKQARDQVGGLTTMFLLGMGVNLIGMPSETTGGAKTASSILLGLHALLGIGLVAGGLVTLRRTKASAYTKTARAGLIAVLLTFVCGVMTAITKSNWWSYAMSVGFITNFWIYGMLFVKTRAKD